MSYFDFFFHADRHINNKKQIENFFMLDTTIPKAWKKWPRQEMEKTKLSMTFDKFRFLNFVDISILDIR